MVGTNGVQITRATGAQSKLVGRSRAAGPNSDRHRPRWQGPAGHFAFGHFCSVGLRTGLRHATVPGRASWAPGRPGTRPLPGCPGGLTGVVKWSARSGQRASVKSDAVYAPATTRISVTAAAVAPARPLRTARDSGSSPAPTGGPQRCDAAAGAAAACLRLPRTIEHGRRRPCCGPSRSRSPFPSPSPSPSLPLPPFLPPSLPQPLLYLSLPLPLSLPPSPPLAREIGSDRSPARLID